MKTQNGRELGLRDQAVGVDAGGRAIGGEIIEIDAKNNRALLSPALMHPSWVDAGNLYAPPTYQDPNKATAPERVPVEQTASETGTEPAKGGSATGQTPNSAAAQTPTPETGTIAEAQRNAEIRKEQQ